MEASHTSPTPAGSLYVVLAANGENFRVVANKVNATGTEAAIRQALNGRNGEVDGFYVAVPQRSWKPVKVEVQQTTTIKLT